MGTRQSGRRPWAEVTATGAMTLPFDFKGLARFLYLSLFQSRGTNYRLTPRRIGWLALSCLIYPLLEIVTRAGLLNDDILLPRYRSLAVHRPVFIVGNPRSGMTFLYHLLAQDEQFTCRRMWEVFFAPAITMRKACKADAAADRLLGSPLQRLLAWGEARGGGVPPGQEPFLQSQGRRVLCDVCRAQVHLPGQGPRRRGGLLYEFPRTRMASVWGSDGGVRRARVCDGDGRVLVRAFPGAVRAGAGGGLCGGPL